MRVSDNALRKLIKGTFLATLLLAAQEGASGAAAYFGSLYRGVVGDLPRIIGSLPTVLLLVLASILHWKHDHRNPDGSVTVGYETIALNVNVVLLFIFSILAAYRSGASARGTIVFARMNAALGWIIVTVELALE